MTSILNYVVAIVLMALFAVYIFFLLLGAKPAIWVTYAILIIGFLWLLKRWIDYEAD